MMSKIYILFPYLNSFQSFEIEGIQFKGLFDGGAKIDNNFAKEDKNDQYHMQKILGSFRIDTNHGLQGFTYSIQEVNTQEEYQDLRKRLEIATNIIRYKLFDKDERGHITFPQTSLYVFELAENEWIAKARKLRSTGDEFIWYKGRRDFNEETNIHWPKELIYPPTHRMGFGYLQISQNYFLISTLQKENWQARNLKEDERLRTIRAIEHYNKSYAEGTGVDDRDRILTLSAGFEALMNLPEERIQQAFRSVVITLLGDISNLGDWALEFYNLRSKIIHGEEIATAPRYQESKSKRKKIPSLYFKHAEGESEYIKHLTIGQSVFRKCLEMILGQRSATYTGDITTMLVPNEVHIKHIKEWIKTLQDKSSIAQWYESRILDAYSEIKTRYNTARPERIVEVGNDLLIMLKKYLQDKKVPLDKEIDSILTYKGRYIDLAMAYHALSEEYTKIYFGGTTKRQTLHDMAFENAAYNFISFASHALFIFEGEVK